MNAVRVNESGTEEYVYCPVCEGELLLGEQRPDGSIFEPDEGDVVIKSFSDDSNPIVLCRDCDFKQIMAKEDVYVYDGPHIADPYADR